MTNSRVEALIARLEKGHRKTLEIFAALDDNAWQTIIYTEPIPWTLRNLLAHFVSSEEKLLLLAQNVAGDGDGAPIDFDFDAFNAKEQERLKDHTHQELLAVLCNARQATLDWVRTLDDSQLDLMGRHPALGEVTLETMLTAIYGHQLVHMRDVQNKVV